jgi:hypothetical protein
MNIKIKTWLPLMALVILSGFILQGSTNSSDGKVDGIAPGDSQRSIAPYFVPATSKKLTPDADGFIQRWLLLEPISKPNRSNTVFTDSYLREAFSKEYFKDQFTVLPKDGDKVTVTVPKPPAVSDFRMRPGQTEPAEPEMETVELKWHALESTNFNVKLFRFATGLQKQEYGVMFLAVTVVNSPEDIENVRMAVGSNSASMWWLNGEEAVFMSGDRRMVMDDCVSPRLTLKKGKNIVRGAVINGPGMSDFCVRFIDENGQPVKNITITCE